MQSPVLDNYRQSWLLLTVSYFIQLVVGHNHDQPPSLACKVVVVTGASRGIGKGIATVLGEHGATVYVTGRTTVMDQKADHREPQLRCFGSMGERGSGVCRHGRDDPIVRAIDQIMQIAARDGPEYG